MSELSRRSSVQRLDTDVSGQRQPLAANTMTSTATMAANHAAAPCAPRHAANGIATMHATNNAHTTVCVALIAVRTAGFGDRDG